MPSCATSIRAARKRDKHAQCAAASLVPVETAERHFPAKAIIKPAGWHRSNSGNPSAASRQAA